MKSTLFPICLLYSLFFSVSVSAQREVGLHFMRQVAHATQTNPAFIPENRRVMPLLGFANELTTDGVNYNVIVGESDGAPVIDVDRLLSEISPQVFFRNDYRMETYGFSVPIKKDFQFSFGHALRYHAYFKYPKELLQVLLQGNAQFIGETIDVSNDLQLTGYNELRFGLAHQLTEQLSVGATIKFLSGFADASTDRNRQQLSLYTDPDVYQLTLNSDYVLNTASSIDYKNLFSSNIDFSFRFTDLFTEPFFSGNTGLALDLGARWKTEKLDLSASIVDLGGIKWEDKANKLVSIQSTQYDGVDFSLAISGGGNSGFENALDSLQDALDFEKVPESYRSRLPVKMYVSGMYLISDKYSAGATFIHERFRGEGFTTFGLGGNAQFTSWLNGGITYSINETSALNMGLNATLQSKSFQFFAFTDNFLHLFNLGEAEKLSFRLGTNLFF